MCNCVVHMYMVAPQVNVNEATNMLLQPAQEAGIVWKVPQKPIQATSAVHHVMVLAQQCQGLLGANLRALHWEEHHPQMLA